MKKFKETDKKANSLENITWSEMGELHTHPNRVYTQSTSSCGLVKQKLSTEFKSLKQGRKSHLNADRHCGFDPFSES